MPDISTSFRDDELEEIQWAANKIGMTVEEFTAHAANQIVRNTKEDMRKRIQNPKAFKKLK